VFRHLNPQSIVWGDIMIESIGFMHALAFAALTASLAAPARADMIVQHDLTAIQSQLAPVPIPEPSSLLLLGVGLIAVGLLMRHHRRRTLK
jgi:hypothetical protein